MAKNAGAKATREDNSYWYDSYDSSSLLEGSSELLIGYEIEHGKFARAQYKFDAIVNAGKVMEVRDMVVGKYGKPSGKSGNPSVGEVKYTWKLKDGIQVEVSRGWPDTTVYLAYIHPANFAKMEREMKEQDQQQENEKRSKQNKAF
jgi:hypothetical protein